jgi:hypothetical protein
MLSDWVSFLAYPNLFWEALLCVVVPPAIVMPSSIGWFEPIQNIVGFLGCLSACILMDGDLFKLNQRTKI